MRELVDYLEESAVETRPILTGNILRQPVAKKLFSEIDPKNLPGFEIIYLINNYNKYFVD